jgi:hypothetical protein
MKIKIRHQVVIIALVAGIAYLLDRGVLFNEKVIASVPPSPQATLMCRFLTLTGVKEKTYWHSPNDVMGKSRCRLFMDQAPSPGLARSQTILLGRFELP